MNALRLSVTARVLRVSGRVETVVRFGMKSKISCVVSVTMTFIWGVIVRYLLLISPEELPFGRGGPDT